MLGAEALLGFAGKIGSTILSNNQTERNNAASEAHSYRQEALQREFAQNGIQWKVADAQKAGIHPLYALGAQTQSYSPTTVGRSSTDFSGLGDAGQNIGRAIDATRNPGDKAGAVLATQLQLESLKLDNDIKRQQLLSAVATNRSNSPGIPTGPRKSTGPGGEFDGQGNAISIDGPSIKVETKRDVTDPDAPAYVPGAGPSVMVTRNNRGGFSPVMPPELAESYESDLSGRYQWQYENRVMPNYSWDIIIPKLPGMKPGEEAYWSKLTQDWRIRKKQYGPWLQEGRSYKGAPQAIPYSQVPRGY